MKIEFLSEEHQKKFSDMILGNSNDRLKAMALYGVKLIDLINRKINSGLMFEDAANEAIVEFDFKDEHFTSTMRDEAIEMISNSINEGENFIGWYKFFLRESNLDHPLSYKRKSLL